MPVSVLYAAQQIRVAAYCFPVIAIRVRRAKIFAALKPSVPGTCPGRTPASMFPLVRAI
jgi:hypothetical protein